MILIDALFIANDGGGPNLLRYLIDEINTSGNAPKFFLLLDERFQYNVSGFQHVRIKGSISGRVSFYLKNRKKFTRVFCFTNIAPPVRLNVRVDTYFHNQLLLESSRYKFDSQYRSFYLRYLFVKLFNGNTDNYIVQTPHMVEEIVSLKLKDRKHCLQYPFFRIKPTTEASVARKDEFVYVSTPSHYKNHDNLFKAWELLHEKGLNPVLHVTVADAYTDVISRIKTLTDKGISIVNHGYTDPWPLYRSCRFLIYPSLNESFGLGLVEAATAGMQILAADLPYVRSVIRPGACFNPHDPVSIADFVEKALKNPLPNPEILVKDEVKGLIDYLID